MCRLHQILASSLLVLLAISGCINQQIYESVQHSNKLECEKNPEYSREKCLRQVNEPYEDYEAHRQSTLEGSE